MKRMVSISLVLTLALIFGSQATVGAAGPSEESGIISRFIAPGRAFIADPASGLLAVIGPESLADLCDGGLGDGDMLWLDIPSGEDVIKILLKDFGGAAFVVPLVPRPDLCAEPLMDPLASGIVNLKITDNDFHLSDTKRSNAFGYMAAGKMIGPGGEEFNFNGHVRWVINKRTHETRVLTSMVHLVPVG